MNLSGVKGKLIDYKILKQKSFKIGYCAHKIKKTEK